MPKVSRNILKAFFTAGAKPSSLQFNTFIDSTLNIADDRFLLGLKNYDSTLIYILGDAVIYNQIIYQATTTTSAGPFNIAQWNKIAGSTPGSVNFKGTWNASTNTPNLISATPALGDYYIVSVQGNTTLNAPPYSISDWNVGDWAIFDGTRWGKVDNTDAITDATNVGTGVGVYKGKNDTVLEFKGLTNINGSLNITPNTDTVDIGVKFDDNGVPPSANIAWSAFKINSELNTKEPAITGTGNITDFWSGTKTFRNLADDVRAVVLTGLSLVTNQVIGATDTIVQAFGYLQKQVSDNLTTLTTHIGNTSNPHTVTKAQVGLANVQDTKVNLTAIIDPIEKNDSSQGYSPGSSWINTVLKKEFVCVDATVGAAVWKETGNIFGNDYELALYPKAVSTSSTSFQPNTGNPPDPLQILATNSRNGTYRIQWSCIVTNNKKQGEFRLVDYTTPSAPVQIGLSIIYEATNINDQISLGGTANVILDGKNKNYIIQFRAVGVASTETVHESKMEIFRVS